ncbi:MAG: hypothetical protein LUD68_09660, partial [Rikenellaceae bacterium]|nr:hypothetical protein [Rikenellaceae bacterium]
MTGVGGPTVKVEISLAKTPEGEYQLSARIGAHIPHVDQKEGLELMEQAHRICPYSRATHGNIHSELYILE